MANNQMDIYLMSASKYLPQTAIPMLRDRLQDLSSEQLIALNSIEFKDPTMVLIIAIFFCGVDRMLIGQVGLGVLKMITAGGCGIWWLIDLFSISEATRQYNLNKLNETLILLR